MGNILSKHTHLAIHQVEDGMRPEADSLYLIPPKHNLLLKNGLLKLEKPELQHGVHLPIDVFFQSLAESKQSRAIGIVLSGTGSDGTRGVRAIKEAGGMVMVQDEQTAKFDGMPRAAMATGLVDYVLPPEQMPRKLLDFLHHVPDKPDSTPSSTVISDEENYQKIARLILRQVGLDLTLYKPSTVSRRIHRRMTINQIDDLGQYVQMLEDNAAEVTTLYRELLIGVTSFFRDPQAFKMLQSRIIPELFAANRDDRTIRVWVAGCSTGEEVYSLAMLLDEYQHMVDQRYKIMIFATDIDQRAVEYASAAVYPEGIANDLSPQRLARYFTRSGDYCEVCRQLREMVIFATHNVIKDPPFARLDMVSCRNLLIYLKPQVQQKVLGMFSFALKPGGTLFLGTSESVGEMESQYQLIDSKWKLYRNRRTQRLPLPDLTSPLAANVHSRQPDTRSADTPTGASPLELRRLSMNAVYENLIEELISAAVVVDQNNVLLHVIGDVDRYIRLPRGDMSTDILKMVHPDLSAALSAALSRSFQTGREMVFSDLRLRVEDDNLLYLAVHAKPVYLEQRDTHVCLVRFEPTQPPKGTETPEVVSADESARQRIADLQRDLQYTKENLQATIEELETSNEELQATNEELIASNEELQSTNEELQSVNEELYTVNAEYQNKIEELIQLNNDMDNLLESTNVGTLFLDSELTIRKFTPAVNRFLNIMEQDIGRPVTHLSHRMNYPRFIDDCRTVLAEQKVQAHNVEVRDGNYVLVRIASYLVDGQPSREGVVVSFIYGSELREVENVLRKERDLVNKLMKLAPAAILVFDREGRIIMFNESATRLLGMARHEAIGKLYNDEMWQFQDPHGQVMAAEEHPFELAMQYGEKCSDRHYRFIRPDGSTVQVNFSASEVLDAQNDREAVICALYQEPGDQE
jgi:two-component system CheB/CheR fusion protein